MKDKSLKYLEFHLLGLGKLLGSAQKGDGKLNMTQTPKERVSSQITIRALEGPAAVYIPVLLICKTPKCKIGKGILWGSSPPSQRKPELGQQEGVQCN